MSDVIIKVTNLAKRYRLNHQRQHPRYATLRDVIAEKARRFFRPKTSSLSTAQADAARQEDFWALKNVSFEVKRGDVVGIVGRNGAGKSTLLKILSRITEPTAGRVVIDGRIASLLEVGTGFHPELTGRENVFLNGAILGMSRAEIRKKFDEIVAFAEVEKFLDTPVKRYSSGMYVRLAFAVAAHLDPEILIVDEVLAVGDSQFQKKCLGKMQDVSRKEGRTVLFVSHNMAAVQTLCHRAVMLTQGMVCLDADVRTVIAEYQRSGEMHSLALGRTLDLTKARRWGGNGKARLTSVWMYDPLDRNAPESPMRQGDVVFCLRAGGNLGAVKAAGVQICDLHDRKIVNCNTLEHGHELALHKGDEIHITVRDLRLRPGTYKVGFWLGESESGHIDVVVDDCSLDVLPPLDREWVSSSEGVYECPFECEIVPGPSAEVPA